MSRDPSIRSDIMRALMNFIYQPAETKQNQRLAVILESHAARDALGMPAFYYKGQVYTLPNYKPRRRVNMLQRSLSELMENWAQENSVLRSEQEMVSNYFKCVLVEFLDYGHLITVLPECLHPALNEYQRLRTYYRPITDKDLERINGSNQPAIATIKQRLMLNLIT